MGIVSLIKCSVLGKTTKNVVSIKMNGVVHILSLLILVKLMGSIVWIDNLFRVMLTVTRQSQSLIKFLKKSFVMKIL